MEKDTLRNDEIENSLADLERSWKNSPHPSVKITSYFPAYVELFGHLRDKKCVFIETGVLDGGSLFMWRSWLGEKARIIGVDLNPAASKWREYGFEIYIGDQGDPAFWQKTLKDIGEFDALLDDGGHQSFQQIVTAVEAIKFAKNNCVIAVEDTATSFMNDFSMHGSATFLEYCKDATDVLIGRSYEMGIGRFPNYLNRNIIEQFENVYKMQFFNGIVAFNLNRSFSNKPELVRNRPPNSASDFRYEGLNSALVDWPHPFKTKKVKVLGGVRPSITKKLKSMVPPWVKRIAKKMLFWSSP
ncbi:Mycinamicin VI 2''-O-methyltransferase [compost metagenome]